MITVTEHINALIAAGAMSEKRFFELEIAKWKTSEERQEQITGEKYYRGQHDILKRRRTAIGPDGKLKEISNLPNNKLVNNQYGKIADQKNNYLLGKPFNLQTDDENYELELGEIFNKRFHRTLKNLGEDSLNCGVGWLYVYYDEKGELSFKRFAPWEILPFWKDDEHTVLDCVVRVYETEEYEGDDLKIIEKVEIYKSTGVERYILQDGVLREDGNGAYFNAVLPDGGVQPFNWEKIPV
ncbi:MAG: phage portal protein, partial [Syntrophomonadaceae bacterium]|nr:phage portal protein [Syntrophomonadaceae bacterium]